MKKANENVRKNLELELQELMNATPTFEIQRLNEQSRMQIILSKHITK